MDLTSILTILFFFLILFLIGFGFSLLTYIPQVQRFLLRSRASRVAGLLVLAMLSFMTGLLFSSRLVAEANFVLREEMYNNPDFTSFYSSYMDITIDWDWVFQNRSLIINEFWIESLIPTLSEGTCFSSNPMVCDYGRLGEWPRAVPLGLVAIVYALALIPAFIAFWIGRLFIRKKSPLSTAGPMLHRPSMGEPSPLPSKDRQTTSQATNQELPKAIESYSWLQTWWLALTSPRTSTYRRIVSDRKATSGRGAIWILVSSAIAQIIIMIAMLARSQSPEIIIKLMLCCVPGIGILIFSGIFFYVSAVQFIAGAIGGRGASSRLAYAISAYFAPIAILCGFIVLIPVVRYLTIPLFLYSLVLNLLAIKAVNQFGWGRAITTVLILTLVVAFFLVILYFVLLVPLFETLVEVTEGVVEDFIRDTW